MDTLMRLRPVAFRWKSPHSADLGFVAEDVAKVNRLLAVYERGELQSVKYTQATALLTKVLQEQVRERNKIRRRLNTTFNGLQKRNDELTTDVRELEAQHRELQTLVESLAGRLRAVERSSAIVK